MIEIEGGKLVFKYFYRGDGRQGSEDYGPDYRPIHGTQLRRARAGVHNIKRKSARDKNRENCTKSKRETCDQITDKLCTGDCPTGDV